MPNSFKIGKVLSNNTSKMLCVVEFKENIGSNADSVLNFNTKFASNSTAINAIAPTNKTSVNQSIKNIPTKIVTVKIASLAGWGTNSYLGPYRAGAFEITVSENISSIKLAISANYSGNHSWKFSTDGYFSTYYSATPLKPTGKDGVIPTTFIRYPDITYVGKKNEPSPTPAVGAEYFIDVPIVNNKAYIYADVGDHNIVSLKHYGETIIDTVAHSIIKTTETARIDQTDPVAQTFYINPKEYPNGLFVSKADIFFSSKPEAGSSSSAWIYLTKTVNGYPESSNYITNSRVELPYSSIISPAGTSIAPIPAATTFEFSDPIYLEAGEYSIVVGSDNAKYRVFVSELGSTDLATGKLISTNPDGMVGSFFMSQNARTWTADQTKDMMFNIHKCVFTTTPIDVEIPLVKDSDVIVSDMISITSPVKEIPGTTLKYYSKLTSDYVPINNNTNVKLPIRTTLTKNVIPYVKYTLSSTSTDLSPIIQKDKINVKYIQNAINTKLDLIVDETDPYRGDAYSKYVTKKVVLADGFDATGIRVLLDVNRLHGTNIEVYVKAVAAEDFSSFEGHYYKLVPLKGEINYSKTDDDFVINEFKIDNFSYISGNVTYNSFKTFIVKIVLYSDNPVNFPRVKNLRAIATS